MKASAVLLLALVGFAAAETPSTPVSRVVQLIGQVAKQAEEEGKKEEDLYETYVCWANSIINAKTASNAAAESRSTELKQYIADIEAGRIEFTSERKDLETELAQINKDMETATAMRSKEKADFESASEEMDKTITALESAIDVLKEATADHKEGVLFAQRSHLAEGSEAVSAQELSYAMTLGDRFLGKGDATFLRRLLSGEVPKADWKKLNRKATFKMSYKARSGKIQDVLASLLSTFQTNLQEAQDKEAESQANFEKLMGKKQEQKESAEGALADMSKENGARGMNKEEAQAEVDSLTTQIENDTKYIEQVRKSLAEKKEEWKERSALRAGEIAAMNKAISILHSDDARDLMKKSFASQGYSFLQAETVSIKGSAAAKVLHEAARVSHSARLAALAKRVAAPSHFKEVVDAIDKMIVNLGVEDAKDLKIKERCEEDRAKNARDAVVMSRKIDEMSDLIAQLESEIADLKEQVEKNQEEIKQNKEELKEATRIRETEKAEYIVDKKNDEDTHALIISATGVLENFYKENNLMFIQRGPESAGTAGEAPPPPPPTWEAPYGGKTEESTGVIAILGMVAEDVQKDIAAATAAEEKAQAAYDATKVEIEASIANLEAEIVAHNASIADKETTIESTKGDKKNEKDALADLMTTMAKLEPGCNYFAVNYVVRVKNRQTELDGLQKAKAILEGASFTENTDATREITPGDALLQRAKSNLRH